MGYFILYLFGLLLAIYFYVEIMDRATYRGGASSCLHLLLTLFSWLYVACVVVYWLCAELIPHLIYQCRQLLRRVFRRKK